jgi:hypothetical protein
MVERTKKFRRNEDLEDLLKELNELLEPLENNIIRQYDTPKFQLVLLVGCARSGSTLMMQWLANTGEFAYPTNFLSRFYAAPYIGAKIQQMLTNPKYRYRDEFSDFGRPITFSSELGKTSGVLAPNEYHYFWRRFFNYGEIQYLDEIDLEKVDTHNFCAELAAMEAALEKPLAMKGLIINWNIPFVYRVLPHTLFIYIKRNPIYNAQSLIEARENFLGDRKQWYSFKPPEYHFLENLDQYQQVAGQVYFTNRAIEQGLIWVNKRNWMTITYEEFCQFPEKTYQNIRDKLAFHGYALSPKYEGPKHFTSTNCIRLENEHFNMIERAYEKFSKA